MPRRVFLCLVVLGLLTFVDPEAFARGRRKHCQPCCLPCESRFEVVGVDLETKSRKRYGAPEIKYPPALPTSTFPIPGNGGFVAWGKIDLITTGSDGFQYEQKFLGAELRDKDGNTVGASQPALGTDIMPAGTKIAPNNWASYHTTRNPNTGVYYTGNFWIRVYYTKRKIDPPGSMPMTTSIDFGGSIPDVGYQTPGTP